MGFIFVLLLENKSPINDVKTNFDMLSHELCYEKACSLHMHKQKHRSVVTAQLSAFVFVT